MNRRLWFGSIIAPVMSLLGLKPQTNYVEIGWVYESNSGTSYAVQYFLSSLNKYTPIINLKGKLAGYDSGPDGELTAKEMAQLYLTSHFKEYTKMYPVFAQESETNDESRKSLTSSNG